MKLFILSIAILSTLVVADLQEPEKKLLSPEFLFPATQAIQQSLNELQTEIDGKTKEVITVISNVLEHSTHETLSQYQAHVDQVESLFVPALDNFQKLTPGACRNSAERILNETTMFTGFSASNCANLYNQRVKAEIDSANKAVIEFQLIFNQVQSIVVKGFVGKNNFLQAEEILENIETIEEHVRQKWNETKPELASFRSNLRSAIANQNEELGKCHESVETDAASEFSRFSRMVQTCMDFEQSRSADLFGESFLGASAVIAQQLQEFLVEHAKLKLYEWSN